MHTTKAPSPSKPTKNTTAQDYLRALRPAQWTKNLIVFAPLIFAEKLHDANLFLAAAGCFLGFAFISSGSYLINDVLDRKADQLHPYKRARPVAAGKISALSAIVAASFLMPAGAFISYATRPSLLLPVLCYITIALAYSARLKRVPLLDIFAIAAGFVLRAVAGAVAVKVPVSTWFLLCTSLGALFLALEKRRHELSTLKDNAEAHRKGLTIYTPELVDRLEAVILPGLLTCYVLYSFQSIHGQWMMLTVPFVLYGIMRYQLLSSLPESWCGSPEQVILRDRPVQVAILLWLVCCVLVIYGILPAAIAHLVSLVERSS